MSRVRHIWASRRAELANRQDAGVADPAIVMITIVVLVVLALAGMYIGRGFVEQARDTNAQNDLARIAASEEFYAASAAGYTDKLTDLKSGRVSFTTSTDVNIEISANEYGWIASAKHVDSGNTFYRASGSSDTYQVGPSGNASSTDLIYSTVAQIPTTAIPAEAALTWSSVSQD